MTQAKRGDTIKVDYTGRLDDGSVFDTTRNGQPLEFVLGQDRLIKGFEEAVLGMSPGESKTVKLPPEDAYGPRHEEMVATVERGSFPPDVEPTIGQRLEVKRQDGSPIPATITQVTDSTVTIDANHQLAGQTLIFEIAVREIA